MSKLAEKMRTLNKKVEKKSLTQRAYNEIKEAIIMGEFKPGETLSSNLLAETLSMSRTPIREALKELATEDLVDISPKREATVKSISQADLEDIYELREVLETKAAETAIKNIDPSELARLRGQWLKYLEKAQVDKKMELNEISKADSALHNYIIQKCDNLRLRSIMENLRLHSLRYQRLAAITLADPANTIQQHLEIIDALEEGDVAQLKSILIQHMEDAKDLIINKGSVEIFGRDFTQ